MLVQLASGFVFSVSVMRDSPASDADQNVQRIYDTFSDVSPEHQHRYIVVATQGSGDVDALTTALAWQVRHI